MVLQKVSVKVIEHSVTTLGEDSKVSPAFDKSRHHLLSSHASKSANQVCSDVIIALLFKELVEIFIVVLSVTLSHNDLINLHELLVVYHPGGLFVKEIDNLVYVSILDRLQIIPQLCINHRTRPCLCILTRLSLSRVLFI